MNIAIEPGSYVVAVSGGVDSVALLDMLSMQPGLHLTVAHYDHGIRPDSEKDRKLVQSLAKKYGYPFVYDTGGLGPNTSEAAARDARYAFLHQVREATGADAIITAHHEDDLLETAIINMLRGTNRKGMSSLKSTDLIKRPLLHLSKSDLLMHAHDKKLKWNEDSTNQDTKYLRNHIRHNVIAGLPSDDRRKFRELIDKFSELNQEIDWLITNQLHVQPALDRVERHWFVMLPHPVAREVMATWLRRAGVQNFDRKLLETLVTAAKTYASGTHASITSGLYLQVNKDDLALVRRER